MRWEKLGRLYAPQSSHPKLVSHAANPLAIHLDSDVYRIFFSGRDAENRSSIGWVDINILSRRILRVSEKPVFEFGQTGSYYSHGVSIGNCYEVGSERFVLFMGWQCPQGQHWRGEIGRLRLMNDLSLQLHDNEPLVGVDDADPVSLSYPWVLHDGEYYRMWYGSTLTWDAGNGEMIHMINHARSSDGQLWRRSGCSIPYEVGRAQAFSRPTVAVDSQGYHMWVSYRSGQPGQTYRIGYAHSLCGDTWELCLAERGIEVSESGWDSEMVEYPYVFDHKGQRFMLYNGNGYGSTGFGLAVLES